MVPCPSTRSPGPAASRFTNQKLSRPGWGRATTSPTSGDRDPVVTNSSPGTRVGLIESSTTRNLRMEIVPGGYGRMSKSTKNEGVQMRQVIVAHAHCDLFCGVYDPAQAKIEAMSVLKSAEKYQGSDDEVFRSRAITIKEERAELVKHPLMVLWVDFFTADHCKEV